MQDEPKNQGYFRRVITAFDFNPTHRDEINPIIHSEGLLLGPMLIAYVSFKTRFAFENMNHASKIAAFCSFGSRIKKQIKLQQTWGCLKGKDLSIHAFLSEMNDFLQDFWERSKF